MSAPKAIPTPFERAEIVLLELTGEARAAMEILSRIPDKLATARDVGDLLITDLKLEEIRRLTTEAAAKALAIVGSFTTINR